MSWFSQDIFYSISTTFFARNAIKKHLNLASEQLEYGYAALRNFIFTLIDNPLHPALMPISNTFS